MERGFTSGGQESGPVFSAAVCKIQASKHYVESLPLVLKEAASHKVKGSLYSCLLIARLPSGSRMFNWILEIIYRLEIWLGMRLEIWLGMRLETWLGMRLGM